MLNLLLPRTSEHLKKLYSQLKRYVSAIYLLNPKVKITILDKMFGSIINTSGCCTGVGSAFYDLCHSSKIIPLNASLENMYMNLFLCGNLFRTDNYQFIFVNNKFIVIKDLYNKLNGFLFEALEKKYENQNNFEFRNKHFMYVLIIYSRDLEDISSMNDIDLCERSYVTIKMYKCLSLLLKNFLMICNCFDFFESVVGSRIITSRESNIFDPTICYDFIKLPSSVRDHSSSSSTKSELTIGGDITNLVFKWSNYEITAFLLNFFCPKEVISEFYSVIPFRKADSLWENKTDFIQHSKINKNYHLLEKWHDKYISDSPGLVQKFTVNHPLIQCFDKFVFKSKRTSSVYNILENVSVSRILSLFSKGAEQNSVACYFPIFSSICRNDVSENEKKINVDTVQTSIIEGSCKILHSLKARKYFSADLEVLRGHFDGIPQNFAIAARNTFVPKGSSPLMILLDKSIVTKDKRPKMVFQFEDDIFSLNAISDSAQKCSRSMKEVQKQWKIDKSFFKQLRVIGQFDSKYILCSVQLMDDNPDKIHLVAFDQHAVDERIKLEMLLSRYSETEGILKMYNLEHSILLNLKKEDVKSIFEYSDYFLKRGFQFIEVSDCRIAVCSIPECLHWVATRKGTSYLDYCNFIIETIEIVIEEQIGVISEYGYTRRLIPSVLYNYLCREACLTAINFGEMLNLDTCESLINNISMCLLPFMCAHGRPVISFLKELSVSQRNYSAPSLQTLKK